MENDVKDKKVPKILENVRDEVNIVLIEFLNQMNQEKLDLYWANNSFTKETFRKGLQDFNVIVYTLSWDQKAFICENNFKLSSDLIDQIVNQE